MKLNTIHALQAHLTVTDGILDVAVDGQLHKDVRGEVEIIQLEDMTFELIMTNPQDAEQTLYFRKLKVLRVAGLQLRFYGVTGSAALPDSGAALSLFYNRNFKHSFVNMTVTLCVQLTNPLQADFDKAHEHAQQLNSQLVDQLEAQERQIASEQLAHKETARLLTDSESELVTVKSALNEARQLQAVLAQQLRDAVAALEALTLAADRCIPNAAPDKLRRLQSEVHSAFVLLEKLEKQRADTQVQTVADMQQQLDAAQQAHARTFEVLRHLCAAADQATDKHISPTLPEVRQLRGCVVEAWRYIDTLDVQSPQTTAQQLAALLTDVRMHYASLTLAADAIAFPPSVMFPTVQQMQALKNEVRAAWKYQDSLDKLLKEMKKA